MIVSLDTNVLHQEGYASSSMGLLRRLVDARLLDLVICKMVLREYESRKLMELASKTKSVVDNLRDLNKGLSKCVGEIPEILQFEQAIESLLPALEEKLQFSTRAWLNDFRVRVLDMAPEDYGNIWDDYFSGKGTFKKPKNREDIPDSIIAKTLSRFFEGGKGFIFVSKDGQLKSYMSGLPGVTVYGELSEFVRSSDFERALGRLDAKNKIIEDFKNAIGSQAFLANVMAYFCADDSDFYYSYWDDERVENQQALPLSVYGGVVAGGLTVSSVKDESFGPVACIGPKHYVIPVSFKSEVAISFIGNYAEWLHSSDEVKRIVEIDSCDGDGMVKFAMAVDATISGEVVIHLLGDVEPDSLLIHSEYIGVESSPLDVEFVPGKIWLCPTFK